MKYALVLLLTSVTGFAQSYHCQLQKTGPDGFYLEAIGTYDGNTRLELRVDEATHVVIQPAIFNLFSGMSEQILYCDETRSSSGIFEPGRSFLRVRYGDSAFCQVYCHPM